MTAAPDQRNAYYRALPDWVEVGAHRVKSAADIDPAWKLASICREKKSHRGIASCKNLTTLFASAVDQDFLDEISALQNLEYLWLEWPVTAADLSSLAQLQRLKFLKLDSPRNVTDFRVLAEMPALERLFIENAKHMAGLDWLTPIGERLLALGIEGSMWTMQKVPSLAPLAGFAIEALFMTSVRLADTDLKPLASCPNLRYLACARFAPKASFEALKALRPDIYCSWFDRYEV